MKDYKTVLLPYDNIDTDIIIPTQFLKRTTKDGLGQYAFYEWRYDSEGNQRDSIINEVADKGYNVLIARDNFACGSSREHAAWALNDFGFEVIIASSFSDIFYRNWLNNHHLPIILDNKIIDEIVEQGYADVSIDLENLKVTINEKTYPIKLSKKMHDRLINNIDEIDYTLKHIDKIKKFDI